MKNDIERENDELTRKLDNLYDYIIRSWPGGGFVFWTPYNMIDSYTDRSHVARIQNMFWVKTKSEAIAIIDRIMRVKRG